MKQQEVWVKAALRVIASKSPFLHRIPSEREHGQQQSMPDHEPEWRPAEAGLAWAIFERAALDSYGIGLNHGKKANSITEYSQAAAERTVRTGFILLPKGGRVNILESLGIDPEYSSKVLSLIPTERGLAA